LILSKHISQKHVNIQGRVHLIHCLSLLTIGFSGVLGVASCYGTTLPNYKSRNDFMSSISTRRSHGGLSFISRIFNIIFIVISLPLLPAVKPVAFLIQLLSPNGLHAIASAFLGQLSHNSLGPHGR